MDTHTSDLAVGVVAQTARAHEGGDHRSLHVQDLLRLKWREEIKGLGPAERQAWLESGEGIVAFGAKTAREMSREIRRRRSTAGSRVCSAAWVEAFDVEQQLPPGLIFGKKLRIEQRDDGRRHSVRLMLSRCDVHNGDGPFEHPTLTTGTRRWTPPQCVELEDFIDSMSIDAAAWWTMTAGSSPSAVAILRIGLMRAKPVDGNW